MSHPQVPLQVEPEGVPTEAARARMYVPFRLAGVSAVLAGCCYVLVGVFHPANVASSVTTTNWAIVHAVACAMCIFGVLGMTGLYVRQARKSGWLGLVGYILLSLWFVLIMGFTFVEAFILPHPQLTAPRFSESWMDMLTGSTSPLDLGALPTIWTLTGPIYVLGGLVFGIATFRAGILSRWAGALLALGTVVSPVAALFPNAAQPKIAVPVGIALAWLGYSLWRSTRTGTTTVQPATATIPSSRRPSPSEEIILTKNAPPPIHSTGP